MTTSSSRNPYVGSTFQELHGKLSAFLTAPEDYPKDELLAALLGCKEQLLKPFRISAVRDASMEKDALHR